MLNVLESSPIAQLAIGLDHKVTDWNRACELLTGLSAEEMIGTDLQWKPFYPKKRPILSRNTKAAFAPGFHRSEQFKTNRRDTSRHGFTRR